MAAVLETFSLFAVIKYLAKWGKDLPWLTVPEDPAVGEMWQNRKQGLLVLVHLLLPVPQDTSPQNGAVDI